MKLFANSVKTDSQLEVYAKECNTVEGNTTFYALPHEDAVLRWRDTVDKSFRFTFKFHQNIIQFDVPGGWRRRG